MYANYSILAKYYDKFTQNDCDYVSWSQYLYAIATRHNVREVVDLACGTGKMTLLLSKFGLKLTGVDVSNEMLSQARAKVNSAAFICQDIKRLALAHPVDMAVCVNDGINYIKPRDLTPTFIRIATSLKVGAPLVFDVSSAYKLTQTIGNNVFYWDDEHETLLWSNMCKSDSLTMNLSLFELNGSGSYDRFDEQHTQYIYTQHQIVQALDVAGFSVVEVTADYGKKLSENSPRITFYAVKR